MGNLKLLLRVVLLAIVLFGGFACYRAGYGAAMDKASIASSEAIVKLQQANTDEMLRQALVQRQIRETAEATASALATELQAREATIRELEDEARADRDAGRLCLGADSVRRITKATPTDRP